ncbi:unnamed protein product [Brassica oleracea]
MKQRSLFLILCFAHISVGDALVSAKTCINNNGYFRPNGPYDRNRHLILSSLPSDVTSQESLFFNSSIGQEPNRVHATGMCIPGSILDDCFACVKSACDDLIQNCPNQTNAFSWPGEPNLCYVRYSNTSFSGSAVLDPRALLTNSADINSNLTEFTTIWEGLVVRMIDAASTAKSTPSSSSNHYKADVAPLTPLDTIYALMQCTPDLSSGDCENCLRQSAREYQSCCGQRQGGVVMRPSCFFRWDLYTYSKAFDNITVASSPPPLPPVAYPPPADSQASTINNADNKGISSGVVAAITFPTVITVFILLVLGFVLCRRRKSMQRTEVESESNISTTHSSQYDFKTIQAATNKFSRTNKLGEGGFGEVYKGTLSNGTVVAVKRLSKKSGQGVREFKNEAVLVSKLQHRNLVRLLGFCLEGQEKILIYEFVPNKSLNYFLFDSEEQDQLDWTQRYKIVGGIARGILYLHQDSQLIIIHRDLKASNILLDANMNPKISDFGLSKIFGTEQTQGNTSRIAGTYGYMSPEYAMHGQYSMKSDIYSFGVLVLEIISGKKNSRAYQMDETSTPGNLVTYAWRLWRNGSPLELVDPAIGGNYQSNEVTRGIHIALLCVQENPEDRPMLSTIILMLTSNTITLPVPRLPSFIPQSRHELDQISEGLESSQSTGRSVARRESYENAHAFVGIWLELQQIRFQSEGGFRRAQRCMNRKGNFMPNGTYDANRHLILSSLPSNVTSKEGLFFNGSIGQEPNRVYAVGMCIPGSTSDDCSVCIRLASDRLIKNCTNQTNAFAWPADPTLCHVRYSNTSFLGSADLKPRVLLPKEGDIISNLTEFTKTWEDLVVRMIDVASAAKSTPSSSNNHYRADVAPLTVLQNIYALMQCTPDLSSGDCDTCLRQSARAYQSCCGQKQGGVVTRPSCFFRWDLYAFSKAFDNITVASLPPPRLPPVASPPPAYDHARTTDNNSKGISSGVVAAITVPTVVTVFILLVLGFVLCRRRESMQRTEVESDSDISTPQSSQYDFKTVEAATNKFSRHNKLGEGGFGEVYKGTLSNGTEVAVKRLSEKSGQGIREFKNEAVLVSKLQHRNLVKLLGFCLEGEEKILIYEFVPNKSLDYFLFDPEEQDQLHWTQRYKIIGGIARGILYLHQDSQLTVIHRDLKASNILLDANMNPKISDFGLSTIFGMEQTRGNTSRIAGTYGYMSPEYAMQGQYSMKSDIYSFGVLVLEIISGKKNGGVYQMDETSTPGNLVTYGFVSQKLKFDRSCKKVKQRAVRMELTITQPDDWHLHLRDGDLLQAVVPHSASNFRRAIVMPNLKPPVTTTSVAITNRESIMKALPHGSSFDPLMTLYLTDKTHPDEIKLARESGVVYVVKLYPAGATTNSQDGVTDLFGKCLPVLEEMVKQNMPLLVHGEVTDPKIDVFHRERIFIETVLQPLIQRLPQLKVVMEHITTMDAVNFVQSCQEGFVGATVTPQHLLLNRNALFQGGLQPHNYCLPVLKREIHREAIVKAVTSGSKKFFLRTDSAPHERRRKESSCGCAGIYSAPVALSLYAKVFDEAGSLDKLEAFTSFNGPDFYGLPRNLSKITLKKAPWKVPEAFSFSFGDIIPMFAGETLQWKPFFE